MHKSAHDRDRSDQNFDWARPTKHRLRVLRGISDRRPCSEKGKYYDGCYYDDDAAAAAAAKTDAECHHVRTPHSYFTHFAVNCLCTVCSRHSNRS